MTERLDANFGEREHPNPPTGRRAEEGATLADRLRSVRHRSFVGRAMEQALFRQLLGDLSRSFLFVWGQVGVGKSALLRELQHTALGEGLPAILVDARELNACAGATDSPKWQLLLRDLSCGAQGELTQRGVLFIDAFDGVPNPHSLFERLRDLPSDVLLVLASRTAVPPTFLLDNAWANVALVHELKPLSTAEADSLLSLRQVAPDAHRWILDLAHGFPLALEVAARLANSARGGVSSLDLQQEAQHQLAQLVCPLPFTAVQQCAVDACVLARTLTPDLLDLVQRAKQLDGGSEPDAFNWLARQSFVQWTRQGLEPHWLVRSALGARLRRERPRRYQLIQQALRDATVADLMVSSDPCHALVSLVFLDRDSPGVQRWAPTSEAGVTTFVPTCPRDRRGVLELLARVEGPESAALAATGPWAEEGVFETLRGQEGPALLHLTRFDTSTVRARLPASDPVTSPILRYMAEHPLGDDQQSLIFRWAVTEHAYEPGAPGRLALSGRRMQIVLTTANLPYSFAVIRQPSQWGELWTDLGAPWQLVERFTLGRHEYALVVFEWERRSLREILSKPLCSRDPVHGVADTPSAHDDLKLKVSERVSTLARKSGLTPRESEILEQLCLGHSVEGVAKRLSIRPRTVKFHQENLLRKTGASSRVELFRMLL